MGVADRDSAGTKILCIMYYCEFEAGYFAPCTYTFRFVYGGPEVGYPFTVERVVTFT